MNISKRSMKNYYDYLISHLTRLSLPVRTPQSDDINISVCANILCVRLLSCPVTVCSLHSELSKSLIDKAENR